MPMKKETASLREPFCRTNAEGECTVAFRRLALAKQ